MHDLIHVLVLFRDRIECIALFSVALLTLSLDLDLFYLGTEFNTNILLYTLFIELYALLHPLWYLGNCMIER